MKLSLRFLVLASGLVLLAGICATSAHAQGGPGGSQGGGFGGTPGGGSSGSAPISRSTTSLFPSSNGSGGNTSGSSSSLFPGSTSSMSSTGSSSSGSSGSTESITKIDTGTIGAGNTPLTRGPVIQRDTGSVINSNADVIGGQAASGNNQFANLISQMGRQINQGGNFNQQGGRNTARSTLRIPMRLGFVHKPVPTAQFTARFEGRIANLSGINSIGPIRIAMNGSTAVLRGAVPSQADKDLAEGVALLEPEVEFVQNELVVQEPASEPEELTPPTTTP